ncbi:MAG TPA: GNAT family N-acetyltransferase [Rhizobiaceae bacterium]
MSMPVATGQEPRQGSRAGDIALPPAAVALEPDFDFLSGEYRELFEASCATAFQHPAWLDAFYRTMMAPHDAEKLVVTGRDGTTGALLFVLPLLRRRRAGVALIEAAHLGVGDYAHPVVLPELRGEDFVAAVEAVLPPYDILNIRPVREEAIRLFRSFLPGQFATLDFCAHAAALSAPFTAWRDQALEAGFRKYLDRKKRRFLKAGKVELERVDADFRDAIDLVASIRVGRFKDDILQNAYAREFYADVAAKGGGFARVYRLKLDGADVAQAFGLVLGGRFHYLLIGADYERFGKHSPGLVLYDLLIEQWIAEGGTVFDFTIGDEAFKLDFGTAPTQMHALVQTATLKGWLALSTFDALRGLRRWKADAKPAALLAALKGALRRLVVKAAVTMTMVHPLTEYAALV